MVGVDPEGSILAMPETMNKTDVTFYEVCRNLLKNSYDYFLFF